MFKPLKESEKDLPNIKFFCELHFLTLAQKLLSRKKLIFRELPTKHGVKNKMMVTHFLSLLHSDRG